MKKIIPFANALALVVMIIINYVSNAGMFNGNTMKTISDRYFNYFTPAGFAFSIWGFIYLGLLGFVLYTGLNAKAETFKKEIISKIGWWFFISCMANSLWVVSWLSDYILLSVLLMIGILLSLIKIIIKTRMELDAHPLKHYLFVFWPFAIYTGWISVALIANISAYLTKIGWDGLGISNVNWAIIMVVAAGIINIIMINVRNLREFATVGIWALFAISVSNKVQPDNKSIVYACYIMMAIIMIFIVKSGLKNKNKSIKSM